MDKFETKWVLLVVNLRQYLCKLLVSNDFGNHIVLRSNAVTGEGGTYLALLVDTQHTPYIH